MSTVAVPSAWMAQGYLPPICARHGGRATRVLRRNFYTRVPPWAYLLLLVGVLVFVIVALTVRTTVSTRLPGCERCSAERRRFVLAVVAGWVTACALLVWAIILASGAVLALGVLALAACSIGTFLGDWLRVGGTVSENRAWVQLKRVDCAFAAAVTGALRPMPMAAVPTQGGYWVGGQVAPGQQVLPGQ